MGMVEIDENELQTLRNAGKFIAEVERQEGGAKEIQKWAKKINPKIRTEEDVAEEYAKPIKEELEGLKKWKQELTGQIDTYNTEQGWESVKKDYGYTEDGMKSLREFAEKNGIKNPKYAAAAYDRENPPAPTHSSYVSNDFTHADIIGTTAENKNEELKRIVENPRRFEDEEVRKFYDEKARSGGKWNFNG